MSLGRIVIFLVSIFLMVYNAVADMDTANKALKAKDYEVAIKEFTKEAEEGNPRAADKLGDIYAFSSTGLQDFKQSFYWHSKAAEMNYSIAQYKTALHYVEGIGTEVDLELAAENFEAAGRKIWLMLQ